MEIIKERCDYILGIHTSSMGTWDEIKYRIKEFNPYLKRKLYLEALRQNDRDNLELIQKYLGIKK